MFYIEKKSCNTIDDPYIRLLVLNKVRNIKVKVFSLMLGVTEKRILVQH